MKYAPKKLVWDKLVECMMVQWYTRNIDIIGSLLINIYTYIHVNLYFFVTLPEVSLIFLPVKSVLGGRSSLLKGMVEEV